MSTVGLNLDRLEAGRSVLEFDTVLARADQLLQGARVPGFQARVRGGLDVDAMDQKILVHGSFLATREVECDRSGEPFDLEYPVEIEVTILRRPGRGSDVDLGQELGEDDNWVIHQTSGAVDLTEAMLEAVVLDRPQHVVHPDYVEPGPVSAGGNGPEGAADDPDDEGLDPRWAALRKLRDQAGPGDDQ